jgi:hypothetical protein
MDFLLLYLINLKIVNAIQFLNINFATSWTLPPEMAVQLVSDPYSASDHA